MSLLKWRRAAAVVLAMLGAWFVLSSVMVLIDGSRKTDSVNDIRHSTAELLSTFAIVFVPGIGALAGAAILFKKS